MKKLNLFFLLAFFAFSGCFFSPKISNVQSINKQQDFSIIGTWEGVSMEIFRNGKLISNVTYSGNGESLKAWSKTTFLFAGKTISHNKSSYSFGNGTYTLEGNKYIEYCKVHSSTNFAGKAVNIHMEMKGDTLIQIFPTNSYFVYDRDNCINLKYIRVD